MDKQNAGLFRTLCLLSAVLAASAPTNNLQAEVSVSLAEDRVAPALPPPGNNSSGNTDTTPPDTDTNPSNSDNHTQAPGGCYGSVTFNYNGGSAGQALYTGPGATISCLSTIATQCGDPAQLEEAYVSNLSGAIRDDGHGSTNLDAQSAYRLAISDDCVAARIPELAARAAGGDTSVISQIQSSHTAYMNTDCDVVANIDPARICDNLNVSINYLDSPVSLIWDESTKATQVSVTQFPLNPSKAGKWFGWEGSNATPLVVYDPQHTGKISGAAQLFGSYTFGKKWKNGYDALASLDVDRNGKLSGGELAPLGVWFDRNQNGISDEGEVYSAAAVGLSAIFFKSDSTDPDTGRITAALGYEVTKDGKTTRGSSVDWFADSYNTKMEAIAALERKAGAHVFASETKQEKISPAASKTIAGRELSGLWNWSSGPSYEKIGPKGLLSLVAVDGSVRGHSLVEVPMKRNRLGLASYIISSPISGTTTVDQSGNKLLTFVVTGKNGAKTINEASLSKDGTQLTGISKVELSRDKTGGLRVFSYNWSAKRAM